MVTPSGEGFAKRFCCGTNGSDLNSSLPSRRSLTKYQPIFEASPDGGHALAVDGHVEQRGRARHVVAPQVVRHLLETPFQRAGLHIERDDRHGPEVVAGSPGAGGLRRRIAGAEVEQPELGIERRRVPHRAAAVLPSLVRFGLPCRGRPRPSRGRCRGAATRRSSSSGRSRPPSRAASCPIARPACRSARHRRQGNPEAPYLPAMPTTRAERRVGALALEVQAVADADDPGEHLAVVDQRRRIGAVAALARGLTRGIVAHALHHGVALGGVGLRRRQHHVPGEFARLGVQRHEMGVHGGDEDLAVAEPDAAVGRPAAERLGRRLVGVVPELGAGLGVERSDRGHRLGEVEHAVGDERRRLEGRRLAGLVDPRRRELRHVAGVDLVERREAIGRIGASVHQPLRLVGTGGEHGADR